MHRVGVVSVLLIAALSAGGRALAEGRPIGLLEFLKTRRERRYESVPRKVLAFYYTWYGRPERQGRWLHWADVNPGQHSIGTSTHYPAKGAYDSQDPEILDYHIGLAKSHGIDAFIATWWGQGTFDDQAFAQLLDHAAKKGFEATLYWETVPGKGRAKIARAVSDLAYVLDKYGSHPAFLKQDGKPVIFVYGRVMDQVGLSEWPEIITTARERTGKDFLLIADGYREDYARLFDGLHTYNPCGWVAGKKPDELAKLSRESYTAAVKLARTHGKIACVTVIPGYDDTKIRKPGLNAERQNGDTYRALWGQAYAVDPDWVLITSWNEWHEGSEIEPSWEDGDKYIQMTRGAAENFRSKSYIRHVYSDGPPEPSAESKALAELYRGKTIGVLPDFGGKAVFWLLDAGVGLRELTWPDVLDPALFNARKLPVVLYAGYESYVQSVREAGDVDRAILRYLGEGGCLAVLPTGPFPFYYNEQKEAVAAAAKFGLPIGGSGSPDSPIRGWEAPPAGVKLAFKLDPRLLPKLPPRVPFPDSGDLRWRPAANAGLAEGDVYLSLAMLLDEQGRDYGDAIACVERRASEPRNARLIYAWFRMADVLPADDLFSGLFRLAAEKATRAPR